MEVRVDSNRIRSEREQRGWSQGHLASVAGLSLRTIQRIEKTGSASFESVTALASVLSLDVADLRAKDSPPPRPRAIRLSLELPMRLALAVVSGVSCALHFSWVFYGGDIGFSIGFAWLDFAASGGLFAVAVLCPYLPAGRGSIVRAAALLGAGATSYCSAMMTAVNADAWFSTAPVLLAFLLASFIGAAIVLVSAKILLPLRVRKAFWSFGLAASLLGGVAMYAGLEVLGSSTLSAVFGFCAWHVLVCLAIHFGRASNEGRAGLLADFARARGRFSIVPGWLRLSHSALR